uniref:Uncharacterized protein n=1 Tax=Zea mays TaxID=4577 RepID=B6U9Y3_MAIZE|nr:hypothetical protein [Zea mays]
MTPLDSSSISKIIWFTKYTMKNIISSKHHFSFVC